MEKEYKIKPIEKELGLKDEELLPFGNDKAKVLTEDFPYGKNRKGKIILTTAITPTKAGEGKTTTAIGLADGLKALGANALLALREPSLGPVFGVKGGGAGGGEEIVVPEEDINLLFTGDIPAMTAVNNLLVAMIDNELYQHSDLDVDPERIVFPRAMDMNERSLRDITVAENDPHTTKHKSSFVITAASEIMAVFCLSKDEEDFLNRVEDITLAYDRKGRPITAKMLECRNAIHKLIHTALYPNLVQTKYHTPALVHGGPFANIAHGTNSLIATDLALKLGDYVVTEGGFGSDLGMEKYLDIVSPLGSFHPSLVVMVATIRALKLHGGVKFEDLGKEDVQAAEEGTKNLLKHLSNVSLYHLPVLVSLNRFASDTDRELAAVEKLLDKAGYEWALNTSYKDGPKGAMDLACKAKELADKGLDKDFAPIVDPSSRAEEKIDTIAKKIYGADKVEYTDLALQQLAAFRKAGIPVDSYSVVISKTPNSLSDNAKLLNVPKHTLHVESFRLFTGAKFLVPLTGNVFTMPGLPKVPAAKNMTSTER
ncbi:MAG: formate--tetrahydrofolate ligase [Bacilli bacterium]|jgi:formate--tetrahydrofolate ligase